MTERISRSGALRERAVALIAIALLLAGCAGVGTAKGSITPSATKGSQPLPAVLASLPKNADGYTKLTAQQLNDALAAKGFALVNVHVPYAGELPQTDLFIAYDQIAQQANKPPDKSAPIVLYCRSGHMSTSAAKTLVKLGYTNVLELDGGMGAWESAGYQVLQKQ